MRPAARVARAWGFGVADVPERGRGALRPATDIAARLMACDAVCSWLELSERNDDDRNHDERNDDGRCNHVVAESDRLRAYVARNGLAAWMTADERRRWDAPRAAARSPSREDLWPLAWALGYEPAPPLDGATVTQARVCAIVGDFLPGLDATVADVAGRPRPLAEVAAVEDLFYCAEHAVSLPVGFDPAVHGEVVRRRRRALTFCLGGPWDDVA
jgi:hypothetical protein